MRGKVSGYLRQNALACVALFFALTGGVAWATHPGGANTISSVDIINGEVRSGDLADDSVHGGKLKEDSTASRHVVNNTLRSEDILDGQIEAIDVAFGTLRGEEIQDGTLGGNDVADNSLHGEDIDESTLFNDDSLTTADLANSSVGRAELAFDSVRADELGDALVNRADPTPVLIGGGAAHNGAYNFGDSDASCNAGEELIGASAQWGPVDGTFEQDDELFIRSVFLNHAAEQALVSGGNDSGDSYRLTAVATCMLP